MSAVEEDSDFLATQRYAIVTGSNKGIGLEVCKQLASKGILVVLTARDENKGKKAMETLKDHALSQHANIVFHQLDVLDPSSISSLVDFIKSKYGKLDILVNNAAVLGVSVNFHALEASKDNKEPGYINWGEVSTQPYNLGEECIQTNYYGAKRMIEAFTPLLSLSESPRIVNVSSSSGKLKFVINEWAINILNDVKALSEEGIDEILEVFLKDLKEDSLETKNWPAFLSAYTLSKAAMNAYTRLLAKKHPSFIINSVCPGYVKTSINYFSGFLNVEEGAQSITKLVLLPMYGQGQSGLFFYRDEISSF
ncbi:hypothetical protein L2E82_14471 [Cichorium intybus]|uniref:Uncharacterized protein n=1 Tax=Cichorium intybus TaxID=13427 RepID=A0ACB9F029_CICIN|nr:hypothetical protein L2E82_14471 [Cichorium intybus]